MDATDTLSVRAGPSVNFPRIGHLEHDAIEIQTTACIPTISFQQYENLSVTDRQTLNDQPRWCLVSHNNEQLGWVNGRYLGEGG